MPWWVWLLGGLWCLPAASCVVAFLWLPPVPGPDGESATSLTSFLGKLLATPLLLLVLIVLWPCLLCRRSTLEPVGSALASCASQAVRKNAGQVGGGQPSRLGHGHLPFSPSVSPRSPARR